MVVDVTDLSEKESFVRGRGTIVFLYKLLLEGSLKGPPDGAAF